MRVGRGIGVGAGWGIGLRGEGALGGCCVQPLFDSVFSSIWVVYVGPFGGKQLVGAYSAELSNNSPPVHKAIRDQSGYMDSRPSI